MQWLKNMPIFQVVLIAFKDGKMDVDASIVPAPTIRVAKESAKSLGIKLMENRGYDEADIKVFPVNETRLMTNLLESFKSNRDQPGGTFESWQLRKLGSVAGPNLN